MSRSPSVPNLVTLAQRVSELEGKKRKYKSAPCGRTFAPPGRFDPMALKSHQGPFGLKVLAPGHPPVWAVAVLEIFSYFSRGSTWRVTRDTWRHVTHTIVVPDLWRIFWCRSRPYRLRRSGAIDESPWTDTLTDPLTD